MSNLAEINKFLNKPKTLLGIPYDELVPAAIILFLFLAIFKEKWIGLGLAAAWWFTIRRLKAGRGSSYLLVLVYKYSPDFLQKAIFKNTPSSSYIRWRN